MHEQSIFEVNGLRCAVGLASVRIGHIEHPLLVRNAIQDNVALLDKTPIGDLGQRGCKGQSLGREVELQGLLVGWRRWRWVDSRVEDSPVRFGHGWSTVGTENGIEPDSFKLAHKRQ